MAFSATVRCDCQASTAGPTSEERPRHLPPGAKLSDAAAASLPSRDRTFTVGNVVDAVQVPVASLVKHVLPLGSHYFDGIRSKEDFAGGPRNNERKHFGLEGLLRVFPSQ